MQNTIHSSFEKPDYQPATELVAFLLEKGEITFPNVQEYYTLKVAKDMEKVTTLVGEIASPEKAPVSRFPLHARLTLAIKNLKTDTFRATAPADQVASDIFEDEVMLLLSPALLSPEGRGAEEGYVSQTFNKALEYWAVASAISPRINVNDMLIDHFERHPNATEEAQFEAVYTLLQEFKSKEIK